MEDTYSESDVSLSPSQILERLQVLKQLQLLQRGKLQKQRLQYKETSETSSSITEIVSHFSNSTSYNTFRSLLQSSHDISHEGTPRYDTTNLSPKVLERDLIEGVSVLNLSQESEFVVSSPVSSRSRVSIPSRNQEVMKKVSSQNAQYSPLCNVPIITTDSPLNTTGVSSLGKKQISLDDMPILSPQKDFESLLLEKLQNERNIPKTKATNNDKQSHCNNKKPFLKRGEGIARFGLKKNDFVIQNTKSLPWRRKSFQNKSTESPLKISMKELKQKQQNIQKEISQPLTLVTAIKQATLVRKTHSEVQEVEHKEELNIVNKCNDKTQKLQPVNNDNNIPNSNKHAQKLDFPKNKHPLVANKGKTWAAVLTKEQNDFLQQLKQSDYYKNFNSPTKSIVSDTSCDETMSRMRVEREIAEQNMFDLLENKVCHDSFNINNSFFNRFLRRSNLECSGESTPLVMQRCLSDNPELRHIYPELQSQRTNENTRSDVETSCSNYSDCCSDGCSSVSCCSCKTVEETPQSNKHSNNKPPEQIKKKVTINQKQVVDKSQDDTMTENDVMKANMAEMNSKLIATSELLKERLQELEDEIETFRKENSSLAKLREELDQDRQKFYEEKSAFEQKFNEEKVLAEYYLAEEKDKLTKQKQIYERQVREMRGRLNKKEKDEVVNLKKEINDLKEDTRMKDAKSTSTIARLRNQIKIMEKEKKDLLEEVEKLKKTNRRIQHSNEVSRRLTNIKYLEEINKKLTNMAAKDTQSEIRVDNDIKYKAYEIERQSRSRKLEPVKGTMRQRAKSVPNLNVTSRYAKYFSQRDTASQMEQNKLMTIDRFNTLNDDIDINDDDNDMHSHSSIDENEKIDEDNNLEKMYMERFRSMSPKSNRSSGSNNIDDSFNDRVQLNENAKGFFIQKSNSGSIRSSKSPQHTISPNYINNEVLLNRSKSPVSILSSRSANNKSPSELISNYSNSSQPQNRTKSPLSMFNHSSLKSTTVIHKEQYNDKLSISPEPSRTSKSSISKTSLNPTEYKKSDGSRELRFPNGNVKHISADGKYSKFVYYNGDVKENFYNEGRIKYYYAETKTYHTTHADGLEVLEFPDGQVEKRYKDGSTEIRLPNGSIRYFDPKNEHVREEWRFPDGAALTVSASGDQRIVFSNGQVEVHAKDHKRREFPDGTVKLVYNDGTSETRYSSGRVRIKDKHGNLIMDSAPS